MAHSGRHFWIQASAPNWETSPAWVLAVCPDCGALKKVELNLHDMMEDDGESAGDANETTIGGSSEQSARFEAAM
jgi:hypothetical protein